MLAAKTRIQPPATTVRRSALGRGLSDLLDRPAACSSATPSAPAALPGRTEPIRSALVEPPTLAAGRLPAAPPRGAWLGRLAAQSAARRPVTQTGRRPDPTPSATRPESLADDYQVTFVPIDRVHPATDNRQRDLSASSLASLAASIYQNGLLQPLIVTRFTTTRPGAGQYQVSLGTRWLFAARLAGLAQVPVIVRPVAPGLGIQYALADDRHREPLNSVERARLLAHFSRLEQLSEARVAERLGRTEGEVARDLQVLSFDPDIQAAIEDGWLNREQIAVLGDAPTPRQRRQLWSLTRRYHWTPLRMRVKLAAWQTAV